MNDGTWRQFAACRGHDRPDLWHPEPGDDPKPALRICRQCHAREECLAAALRRNEVGIWGGLTYRQRRTLKARRATAAAAAAGGTATAPADHGNHTGRVCPNCGTPVKRGTYCSRDCGKKATCGTERGAEQHRYYKEPMCDPCAEARRVAQAGYYQRRRQRKESPVP